MYSKYRMIRTNQSKVSPVHLDHCHNLFRVEFSNNQVILYKNIHLRMVITDLCGVFAKTDDQWWNKSHMHYCYVTMWSICCHCDKSLAPKSWFVMGDWSCITRITMVMLDVSSACRQGDRACQMTCWKPKRGGGFLYLQEETKGKS